MESAEPCEIGNGKCTRCTKLAILVVMSNGDEVWMPRSVIHDNSEVYDDGHDGKIIVHEWWAEERGYA